MGFCFLCEPRAGIRNSRSGFEVAFYAIECCDGDTGGVCGDWDLSRGLRKISRAIIGFFVAVMSVGEIKVDCKVGRVK